MATRAILFLIVAQYSTVSVATGWYTQRKAEILMVGPLSVPSGRCARGTLPIPLKPQAHLYPLNPFG